MEDAGIEGDKRAAGEAAALLVEDGMTVGLGTGSTVAYLLPALGRRHLSIRCVATSPATAAAGRQVGLDVLPFQGLDRLDLTIDGADQVDPANNLVKGGGRAHTREKIVAAAADRFVVIVSANKLVPAVAAPIPLELLSFGLDATLRAIPYARLRDAPPSPDGGVIADYWGPVGDPAELARQLADTPGLVAHGLFPPSMVSEVLIGQDGAVQRRGGPPLRPPG